MEDDTVKIAALYVADKVLDRLGRLLREETKVDVALRRVDRRGRRERCLQRSTRRRGSCGRLLVPGGSLVKDVTVAEFVVPRGPAMSAQKRFGGDTVKAYSGSLRVNM
jgi:hypothetical protein